MTDLGLRIPAGFRLDHLALDGDTITAHITATSSVASCPTCGLLSGRVHSRYRRHLADLPSQGRPV